MKTRVTGEQIVSLNSPFIGFEKEWERLQNNEKHDSKQLASFLKKVIHTEGLESQPKCIRIARTIFSILDEKLQNKELTNDALDIYNYVKTNFTFTREAIERVSRPAKRPKTHNKQEEEVASSIVDTLEEETILDSASVQLEPFVGENTEQSQLNKADNQAPISIAPSKEEVSDLFLDTPEENTNQSALGISQILENSGWDLKKVKKEKPEVYKDILENNDQYTTLTIPKPKGLSITRFEELCKLFSNLKKLSIIDYKLSDRHLDAIASLTKMQSLCLKNCSIGDSSIALITSKLSHLRSLALSETKDKLISESGLIKIATNCKNLTTLKIGSSSVTDTVVEELVKGCSQLKSLGFKEFSKDTFTDKGLGVIAKALGGQLKTFQLHLNSNTARAITGSGLSELVKASPQLETLSLKLTGKEFSDKVLVLLSKCCPQLISFSVGGSDLTYSALFTFIDSCAKLQKLKIAKNSSIDESSARYFFQRFSYIHELQYMKKLHLTR